MIKRAALLVCLSANTGAARDILLALPIDCTLGSDCFIQNYVDADLGSGAADFTCGPLSFDGNKGTEFALLSLAAMHQGVNVLAASPGRVRAVRDDVPDTATPLEGQECGNGVLISHGGDWVTQYCHMKAGTITVIPGQRVGMGKILGQVGLSGNTEFPHLHFAIRYQDQIRDPFNRDDIITCFATPEDQLWQAEIPYQPGGIISTGMATRIPDFQTIKEGEAGVTQTTSQAPALVVWAYLFGARSGDILQLSIRDGEGQMLIQEDIELSRDQAQVFRAIGKRLPENGWSVGVYTAASVLIRDGIQIGPPGIAQITVTH